MDTLTVQQEDVEAVSPGGSPLTHKKLLNFLTVNGDFEDHAVSSATSTADSSLCSTPKPPGYFSEIDEVRRMSLKEQTNNLISLEEELKRNPEKNQCRRHSDHLSASQTEVKEPHNDSGRQSPELNPNNIQDQPYQICCDNFLSIKDENNKKYYPNCDVNVWLRSCEKEIKEPLSGITKGKIPAWLEGSLLRNGPGSLKVGNTQFKHLFDSSALIHRFCIKNSQVTYQCRFLQTNTYKKNWAANRIVVSDFGTSSIPDPCQTIFSRISTMFQPGEASSDNAMISIYPFDDEYFAFTETPVIHKFNPETLETVERVNMHKYIGVVNHTAHPHVMEDGTVYNLGMTVGKTGPNYVIIRFPRGENMFENAEIIASIPVRWKFHPGYMHSFGITTNYFIIVEQPMTVSVAAMVKGQLLNKPMAASLKWFDDKQTNIYLIDRSSGELKYTFYAETFFYLHIINQYEKDGHVILDICCYKDPGMLNCMYVETMQQMQDNPNYATLFRGRPLRFVLPLKKFTTKYEFQPYIHSHSLSKFKNGGSKIKNGIYDVLSANLVDLKHTRAQAYRLPNNIIFCKPELLCDLGCETPRINYLSYLGREYRYFYAISSDVDAENPGTLIKVDVETKYKKTWCEYNVYPSEPIFVPSPNPKSEDDGVILASIVWGNGDENRVGLIVLCAKSFKELGRSVFVTPGPVPKCLHGWFASSVTNNKNNKNTQSTYSF